MNHDGASHHNGVSHQDEVSHDNGMSDSLISSSVPRSLKNPNSQNSAKSILPSVQPVQPSIRKSIKVVSRPILHAESSGGLRFVMPSLVVAPLAETY